MNIFFYLTTCKEKCVVKCLINPGFSNNFYFSPKIKWYLLFKKTSSVQKFWKMTYSLASWSILAKLNSQAYILITLIPWIISFMILIRSSVLMAVSDLNFENCFPIQLCRGTNATTSPATKIQQIFYNVMNQFLIFP